MVAAYEYLINDNVREICEAGASIPQHFLHDEAMGRSRRIGFTKSSRYTVFYSNVDDTEDSLRSWEPHSPRVLWSIRCTSIWQ